MAGRHAVAGRRPSDTLFSALLSHILSRPLECQGPRREQLLWASPGLAPAFELEPLSVLRSPMVPCGRGACRWGNGGASGPAQAAPRVFAGWNGAEEFLDSRRSCVRSLAHALIGSPAWPAFLTLCVREVLGRRHEQGHRLPI